MTSIRDDLLELVKKYQELGSTQVPIVAIERIIADHPQEGR
jgi:septum formation topological specificity factor MinE